MCHVVDSLPAVTLSVTDSPATIVFSVGDIDKTLFDVPTITLRQPMGSIDRKSNTTTKPVIRLMTQHPFHGSGNR